MLFTGVSTIFFNINPLVKIDGYYALCSLIEIPELREESFRWLGALFQRHVLRLNVEVPVVSRRKRRIFLIYGPLALGYIGFIMAFIAKLLDNFYSKVVPELAVVLLLVTLYFFFRKRVRLVVRISRLFYLDKKELVMSPRARLPLLAAAAGLVLLLVVPWCRRTIRMDAVLEPAASVKVETPEDGDRPGGLRARRRRPPGGPAPLPDREPRRRRPISRPSRRAARGPPARREGAYGPETPGTSIGRSGRRGRPRPASPSTRRARHGSPWRARWTGTC